MSPKLTTPIFLAALGMVFLTPHSGCAQAPAPQALRLPAILGDNMVLQQEKPARIWGWAKPGAGVTVSIAGQKKSSTAGADGKWKVVLDPIMDPAPLEMRVSSGTETLVVKNILPGEVWVCSGQSNMFVSLSEAANAEEEIAKSADPKLRFFTTGFHAPSVPDEDTSGKWVESGPETAAAFSSTAYFFGRDLRKALDRPVGLILSANGSTVAESWISREALNSEPVLQPIVDALKERVIDPKGWDMHLPTGLYNGRIAPLTPLAIRGVIWYQGESNATRAWQYRKLFPLLITDWRKAWGEDLPFYFVQLANLGKPPVNPIQEPWSELREAQALALKLPNTGMAVAIDIGEETNIHPKNKQEVGRRLAGLAMSRTYGKKQVDEGPLYQSMKVEGDKIRVNFSSVGGGLVSKGGALKQFAIAGEDKAFVWADAVIDGDSVVVSSPTVAAPVAVRYAWAANPAGCNLYNKEGFPASPFRTDEWPGVTEAAHLRKPGAAPVVLPVADAPRPASLKMTGNTIEIDPDAVVERNWDKIKVNGYAYGPSQKKDGGETRIWLPYGDERGWYYDIKGGSLEPSKPGVPAGFRVAKSPEAAALTLKLHFSKPIQSFRLSCGEAGFNSANAVAGIEYSVDGKAWKPFSEITGTAPLASAKGPKAEGLDTKDLYLRCYVRDKSDPTKLNPATTFRARMGGDVMWGDASSTFAQAQWQLLVTPK